MTTTFDFATYEEHPDWGTILIHGVRCEHTCPETCPDSIIYMGVCDHSMVAQDACGCRAFSVNVSNANAADILHRLGYEVDPEGCYGQTDPEDLLGRAMVANVGLDDTGFGSVEAVGELGCRTIDCGRRPGYFDDTMARLIALATEAKARGVMVGWA